MHATHKHTNNNVDYNHHKSDMHATHKHTNNKWTIITINQTCMLLTSILTISGL